MGCWKWFDKVLKENGIDITDQNRDKIDKIIHQYIGEQSRHGRCSADWKKARKEVKANEQMRQELIEQIQSLV